MTTITERKSTAKNKPGKTSGYVPKISHDLPNANIFPRAPGMDGWACVAKFVSAHLAANLPPNTTPLQNAKATAPSPPAGHLTRQRGTPCCSIRCRCPVYQPLPRKSLHQRIHIRNQRVQRLIRKPF